MKRRRDWLWNLLLILAMLPVAVCVRWNVAVLQRTWAAQDQWIQQIQILQKQFNVNLPAYRAANRAEIVAAAGLGKPAEGVRRFDPTALFDLDQKILSASLDTQTVLVKERRFFASHPVTQLDAQAPLLKRFGLGVVSVVPLVIGLLIRALAKRSYQLKIEGNLCFHCGYCLTGNTSGVCPECGKSCSLVSSKVVAE